MSVVTDFVRPSFRRELTPTWLSATALLAGHRPLDPARSLRVLDLNCASGVTAAVIAAAHPEAEVWAADARPANVERADRLVTRAGLGNVTVLEAGADVVALPDSVDIALVDDVVSTTDESGRARLAAAIGRHVRPGGLVVIGYRTRIGWSEVVPLRALAKLFASPGQPPAEWQRSAIVDLLMRLRADGAAYVVDRPSVAALVELAGSLEADQLGELLLAEHLEPMGFADLAEWLAPIGTSFVGSARLADAAGAAGSPLHDLLDDTRDEPLREAFRDLVTRPTFRIDVFRRGATRLPPDLQRAMLMDLELVALEDPASASDGDVVAAVAQGLGDGSATVEKLLAALPVEQRRGDDIVRGLLARGLAHPRSAGWGAERAAAVCRTLNTCLDDPDLTAGESVLASPVIGSAIAGSHSRTDDPTWRQLLVRLEVADGEPA